MTEVKDGHIVSVDGHDRAEIARAAHDIFVVHRSADHDTTVALVMLKLMHPNLYEFVRGVVAEQEHHAATS